MNVIKNIEDLTSIPLVLHGSSGIEYGLRRKIATTTNVCKFNIGTELRKTFGDTLREEIESNPTIYDRIQDMDGSEYVADTTAVGLANPDDPGYAYSFNPYNRMYTHFMHAAYEESGLYVGGATGISSYFIYFLLINADAPKLSVINALTPPPNEKTIAVLVAKYQKENEQNHQQQ